MPTHAEPDPDATPAPIPRRLALKQAGAALAAIGVVALGATPAHAAEKKKGKASKEDFFYQEKPGEKGRHCGNCVNFEPVASGDKGTCSLLEGEVCKNCYCLGWSDKKPVKKPAA
mgnify:CR=1 FL=1